LHGKNTALLSLPAAYSERLAMIVNFFYKKQKGIGDPFPHGSSMPLAHAGKPGPTTF
jgi:hypothetical protein